MKKIIMIITACISLAGCETMGERVARDMESYTYPDQEYNYPDPAFVSTFYPDSYNSPYEYPLYQYSMPFAPDYYYAPNTNTVYQEKDIVTLPNTHKHPKKHR